MPEYYLGIDFGYSERKPTTGLCLITLDQDRLLWECRNTTIDEGARMEALRALTQNVGVLNGVGIDGPLVPGIEPRQGLVKHYRAAEALLSRRAFRGRCQPGQTNSGNGQHLHRHATELANLVLRLHEEGCLELAKAIHPDRIHRYRIIEAFPTAFLAFLLSEQSFPLEEQIDRDKSDIYWEIAVRNPLLLALIGDLDPECLPNLMRTLAERLSARRYSYLRALIEHLAPGRNLTRSLEYIISHDHRAAFICALSAMCVSQGGYAAVGAPMCGDFILPPVRFWGDDAQRRGSWAEPVLQANVTEVRCDYGQKNPSPNFNQARVICNGRQWMPINS